MFAKHQAPARHAFSGLGAAGPIRIAVSVNTVDRLPRVLEDQSAVANQKRPSRFKALNARSVGDDIHLQISLAPYWSSGRSEAK